MNDSWRSDEVLVASVARGDVAAFELLYGRYAGRIRGWALRTVGAGQAEDALQEIFLGVWRHADQFDPTRGRFVTWLMAIARHRLGRELARRGRVRQALVADEIEAVLIDRADPDVAVEEHAWRRERDRAILECLRALPPDQRRVIVLAYFVGLTQAEIARHLELPLGTVKKRIRLGMQKLRAALVDGQSLMSPAETRLLRVVPED